MIVRLLRESLFHSSLKPNSDSLTISTVDNHPRLVYEHPSCSNGVLQIRTIPQQMLRSTTEEADSRSILDVVGVDRFARHPVRLTVVLSSI